MTPPADEPKNDALKSALDALRAKAPAQPAGATDPAAAALAALRAKAPAPPTAPAADPAAALRAALGGGAAAPKAPEPSADPASVLNALKSTAPAPSPAAPAPDPLAALRAAGSTAAAPPKPDDAAAALAALRAAGPATPAAKADDTAAALAALRAAEAATKAPPAEDAAAALAALRAAGPATAQPPADATADILGAMKLGTPSPAAAPDEAANALAALRAAGPAVAPPAHDKAADVLGAMKLGAPAPATPAPDDAAAALAALRAAGPAPAEPNAGDTAAALAALRAAGAAPAPSSPDDTAAALAALRAAEPGSTAPAPDDAAAALAALRAAGPAPAEPTAGDTAAALAALRAAGAAPAPSSPDDTAAALAALRAAEPGSTAPAPDDAAAALAALRAAGPVSAPSSPADGTAGILDALRDRAVPEPERPVADLLDDLLSGDGSDAIDDLLGTRTDGPPTSDAASDLLDSLLEPAAEEDPLAGLLADVAPEPEADGASDLLDSLLAAPEPAAPEPEPAAEVDPLAALLADEEPVAEDDGLGLLDDLLGGTSEPDPEPAPKEDADPLGDLDSLLAGEAEAQEAPDAEVDPLAALDDLLAPEEPQTENVPGEEPDPLAALDDLLAPEESPAEAAPEEEPDPLAALDDLLAPDSGEDDPLAALEALLADPAEDPALDGLLAELEAPADPLAGLDDLLSGISDGAPKPAAASVAYDPRANFGRLTAAAPAAEALERQRFRIAVLGDFSGRAARGMIDVGVTLAKRQGHRLDIDTAEDLIERFATTLVLPIGEDGRGIEVPLKGIDSLHPDELIHSVALFDEMKGLRQRLGNPRTSAAAVADMQRWRSEHSTHAFASHTRSGAQAIPADRPLSEFQRLIGDTSGRLAAAAAAPADSLIARIVGPYVRPGPAPEAGAMVGEVDKAMSSAMRLVLHHPEFQAIEAAWRMIDLLARRINGDEVEITLYDISAQELAADLATGADLSKTGLFGLLNAPLTELGDTGFSAIFGLYVFEETPPHAELLGRMAQIAAHVQAPFFSSLSPKYLETRRDDRHPLVARAWDALSADPTAEWLSLLSPRFLLRRPYGKRTEPIDAFDFEEFTLAEGLQGMLWGNPAVLMAVLLSRDWEEDGDRMSPGKRLTVNEIPFHYITDPHGDQVALPCTERLITLEKSTDTVSRGLIPVLAVKGRDEVRLGAVQSLAGQKVRGRWTDAPAAVEAQAEAERRPTFSLPQGWEPEPSAAPAPARPAAAPRPSAAAAPAAAMDDLDALLAGFGDAAAPINPDAIDADLAALLEGL